MRAKQSQRSRLVEVEVQLTLAVESLASNASALSEALALKTSEARPQDKDVGARKLNRLIPAGHRHSDHRFYAANSPVVYNHLLRNSSF